MSSYTKITTLFVSISSILVASYGHAYDNKCVHSRSKAEKLLCATDDEGLKWLDENLNLEYKKALKRASNPVELRASQRKWLREKRNACSNEKCLRRVYVERISSLSKTDDDIEGVYLTNGSWVGEPWQNIPVDNEGGKPRLINFLKIERIGKNLYRVSTEVWGVASTNYSCGADVIMYRTDNMLKQKKWAAEFENTKGSISIQVRQDTFIIDTHGIENMTLCGTNGSLAGETFPRISDAK